MDPEEVKGLSVSGWVLFPFSPEGDAAEKAGFIRDDGDVGRKLEVDFLGVAAAEVEVVPVEEVQGLIDGFTEELIPALPAKFVEASAPEIVLVFTVPFPGVVTEFEPRAEAPIGKE